MSGICSDESNDRVMNSSGELDFRLMICLDESDKILSSVHLFIHSDTDTRAICLNESDVQEN